MKVSDDMPITANYDVVCCTAVFEHIYDPNGAMDKICGYMKPESGKVVLSKERKVLVLICSMFNAKEIVD